MMRWMMVLALGLALGGCSGDVGGDVENNIPKGFELGTQSPEHAPEQNEGWNGSNDAIDECSTFDDPCVRCSCGLSVEEIAQQCVEECSLP